MSWKDRFRRFPVRIAVLLAVVALILVVISLLNLRPKLEVTVLSGPEEGNYHAVVDTLADAAERNGGEISNTATSGSVDNLVKLAAAAQDCDAHFALAQDGIPAPEGAALELIGRLRRSEAVVIVGQKAAAITRFSQLAGMTIGIGPQNSGTAHLARGLFGSDDFKQLAITLKPYDVRAQLAALESGELKLGLFVIDDDSTLIRNAMRSRRIEMASFEHLDVLAQRYGFVSLGHIPAGQYDPVAVIPPVSKPVLRVDTLVIGNGCASRSDTVGLLAALSEMDPGFMEHNKRGFGSTSFPRSATAREYFENDGPDWSDTYLPWLVDIMPLDKWFYVVMTMSILFNIMTTWHRFRLWRVDANRDKTFKTIRDVLGDKLTPEEIDTLEASDELKNKETLELLDGVLASLDAQRITCRKQENSILVPMGQEWCYRYQEQQIEATLSALRQFRNRL